MARVALDHIIAAGFLLGTGRASGSRSGPQRSGNRNADGTLCDLCGSRLHVTSGCTGRDDITLGTDFPGQNGKYKGDVPVRTVPPGWSFMDRYAETRLPRVQKGQRWYSPDGTLYLVGAVKGQMVSLDRHGRTYLRVRIRLTTLRARWTYGGQVARRG